MPIRNRAKLLDHGDIESRRLVLDLLAAGLDAADPYRAVLNAVDIKDSMLCVGELSVPLNDEGRIFVIGGGKASLRIAQALEERLGSRISDGVVAIKYGQPVVQLDRIRIYEAAHPFPDQTSVEAAQEAMALAECATAEDIVLTAISGGSSSLLCLPPQGVTLEEKRALHQALILSGATIREVNAVRKHVSRIKGGRLAMAALPARIINLAVSDVVGDPLDTFAGPVVADSTRLADARDVLHNYGLWERIAHSLRVILESDASETPKHLDPHRVQTPFIMSHTAACMGAAEHARQLGLNCEILSLQFEGESRDVGDRFALHLLEKADGRGDRDAPIILLGCGEMTVTMPNGGGDGGANQEAALAAALRLQGASRAALSFLGTDGTDGPTPYAGAVIDGTTVARATAQGLDAQNALFSHDSMPLLERVGDIIDSGHTGTNIADLFVGVSL